jgi:hypothetical protein
MFSVEPLLKKVRVLCTPAYVYLVISVISMVILLLQNMGNTNMYCVGNYGCQVNTVSVFVGKILYVAFWTYVLNYLCKAGYKNVSWFLLLLPFLSLFILLGVMILHKGVMYL